MQLINTRIITHPINWAIIILMLVIAGMFGHLLLTFLNVEPATVDNGDTPNGLTVAQMEPNQDFTGGGSYASSN